MLGSCCCSYLVFQVLLISLLLVASLLWLLPPSVFSIHAVVGVLLLLLSLLFSGVSTVVGTPAVFSIYAVVDFFLLYFRSFCFWQWTVSYLKLFPISRFTLLSLHLFCFNPFSFRFRFWLFSMRNKQNSFFASKRKIFASFSPVSRPNRNWAALPNSPPPRRRTLQRAYNTSRTALSSLSLRRLPGAERVRDREWRFCSWHMPQLWESDTSS